jgi:hypothetical protein
MFSYAKLVLAASVLSSALAAPAPKSTYVKGSVLVEFTNAPFSLSTCLVDMGEKSPDWDNKKHLCPPLYIQLVDDAAPEKGFFLFDETKGVPQPPGQQCTPGNAASDGFAYCGRNVTSLPDQLNTFHFTEETLNKADGKMPKSGTIGTSSGGTTWWQHYSAATGTRLADHSTMDHDLEVELKWSIWED